MSTLIALFPTGLLMLEISVIIGTLDGREVSETERQFLMNWKAMRIERRKQQKVNSFDLLAEQLGSSVVHKIHAKAARLPKAALPLTLPALPARQLPRRSRRTIAQYQDTEDYRAMLLHDNPLPRVAAKNVSEGLRLPKIVPEQRPSLVTQRGSAMDSMLMIQHQPSVGWRPSVHATGGLQDRFA